MRWHEDGEARSGFFKQRADADVLKSQLDGEAVASRCLPVVSSLLTKFR